MRTCGFTGHRIIPEDKLKIVREAIKREVDQAIADGFTRFICGFADGADLTFAGIVAEIKDENPAVLLEAALPLPQQFEREERILSNTYKKVRQCTY